MSDCILREKKTQSKGDDVVVCLPGARPERVTERIENVFGHGQGGSVLVHNGTINADMEETTRIVQKYRELGLGLRRKELNRLFSQESCQ